MFLYDKTNILEGSGIFEVDFAPSHGPATGGCLSVCLVLPRHHVSCSPQLLLS